MTTSFIFASLLFVLAIHQCLASSPESFDFYSKATEWQTIVFGYHSPSITNAVTRCGAGTFDEKWTWLTGYGGFGGKFEIPYGSDANYNCSVLMCRNGYNQEKILEPYLDNTNSKEPTPESLVVCGSTFNGISSPCKCNIVSSQINNVDCDPVKVVCWSIKENKGSIVDPCYNANQDKETCESNNCAWCSGMPWFADRNNAAFNNSIGRCYYPIQSSKEVCEYEGYEFEMLGNAVLNSSAIPCFELSMTGTKNDMTVCDRYPQTCHVGKGAGIPSDWDLCLEGASTISTTSDQTTSATASTTTGMTSTTNDLTTTGTSTNTATSGSSTQSIGTSTNVINDSSDHTSDSLVTSAAIGSSERLWLEKILLMASLPSAFYLFW